MTEAQKLCEILDRIKKQIEENVEPDGTCRFNVQYMEWSLIMAEKTLQDGIEKFKTE